MLNPTFLPMALIVLMVQSCSPRTKTTDEGAVMAQDQNGIGLIHATRQDWVAGIKGGGAGTEYTFTIAITGIEPITFGRVSIGGKDHDALVRKHGGPVTQDPLIPKAGDTLDLRVSVRRPDISSTADTAHAPGAAALIFYTVKGEPRSLPVERIERLAPQNRP